MNSTEHLKQLYYSPESSCSYGSKKQLFREARKSFPNLKLEHVDDFLSRQATYTLHKKAERRFKRNRMVSPGLHCHWQSDLADMSNVKKFNDGFTFLLVVVDVFSRYAWVKPLKMKSPRDVKNAFYQIVKESGHRPWFLYTDKGTEYTGKIFQGFLEEMDIQHVRATSPDVKAAIAERFIQMLKQKIWKYFTRTKSFRYIDVLDRLVYSLNHSYRELLGCCPADVNRHNQNEIYQRQQQLLMSNKKKHKFAVGDRVRIQIEKSKVAKGYFQNYSKEVFTISRILNRYPSTYKLKDRDNEELEGVFYNEELVQVRDNDAPIIEYITKYRKRKDGVYRLTKLSDREYPVWLRDDELTAYGS